MTWIGRQIGQANESKISFPPYVIGTKITDPPNENIQKLFVPCQEIQGQQWSKNIDPPILVPKKNCALIGLTWPDPDLDPDLDQNPYHKYIPFPFLIPLLFLFPYRTKIAKVAYCPVHVISTCNFFP